MRNSPFRSSRIAWKVQRWLGFCSSIKQKSINGKTSHVPSWIATSLYRNLTWSVWPTEGKLKREGEDFQAYAQCWRARAAQVQPPLGEQELVSLFLSTLASSFYEHLISVATINFAAFVQAGQRVEDGIRTEKIYDYSKLKSRVQQSSWKKYKQRDDPECYAERKE